jgi:hypothetical protein
LLDALLPDLREFDRAFVSWVSKADKRSLSVAALLRPLKLALLDA